jgi:hypothetical protein
MLMASRAWFLILSGPLKYAFGPFDIALNLSLLVKMVTRKACEQRLATVCKVLLIVLHKQPG